MLSRRIPRHLGGASLAHTLLRDARPQAAASSLHPGTPASLLLLRPAPSSRRHVHLIQTAVEHTQELITALHAATHTPWYITIPLVALAVNLVRLPFTVYGARILQRRAALTPLLHAWYARHAAAVSRSLGREKFEREVQGRFQKTEARVYRDCGVQTWRLNGSILTFPVWLLAIESVRRLCGGPRGLLGNFFFEKEVSAGTDAAAATTTALSAGPAGEAASAASATPAAPDAVLASGGADVSGTLSEVVASTASHMDASLATGGALWFPSLIEADPYHVLPVLLSGVLAYSVFPKTPAGIRQLFGMPLPNGQLPEPLTWRVSLRRSLLILSLAVGPATMDMPSAVHLYWLSSSCLGLLLTRLVRWRIPPTVPEAKRCEGRNRLILLPRAKSKKESNRLSS